MNENGVPLTAPYWRLSFFYFFYFASLGVLIPYWSLYLKSIGYSVADIGEIMAVIMGTKIVAPNIWGWIADHTGQRMRIIRLASVLSALVFAGVYVSDSYGWMVVVMLLFSFFWNANLPQFEATTLSHLGTQAHRYSRIRLWGSIGFILSVVVVGSITENYGADWVPASVLVLLIGIWFFSLVTPDNDNGNQIETESGFRQVMRRPEVLALFVVCFLLQASHGPYYAFYTIYLEEHGYSRSLIGQLWALGVIAEILVFMAMHRLLPRFGARYLLALSLLLSAVRWIVIGAAVDSHLLMIFAQTLHAASFGLYHAVAIHLVHRFFPGRLQGRGQALYSSLSFGAGGAIGALYSGYIWESGGAHIAYITGAAMCVIAWGITLKYLRRETLGY